VTIRYVHQLTFHLVCSGAALLCLIIVALRRFGQVLGVRRALLEVPLIVLLLGSDFLPITGAMILGWTSFVLLVDWRLARWRLRRNGLDAAALAQRRWEYLDFAIILQCLLSGYYITITCNTFLLIYQRLHGLALPLLLLWFAPRAFRRLSGAARPALAVGLAVILTSIGVFYVRKQILRNDEVDLRYPDVSRTVERRADRSKLRPMAAESFDGSLRCAGTHCHTILVGQWRGSSHRFAVNNALFRKVVGLYLAMEGPEYVRTCVNCHDPAAAMSLDAEERYAAGRLDNPEGISCKACHIITDYDAQRGNGLYTMKAPSPYPFETAEAPDSPERRYHDRAIHLDPRQHVRNFRRKSYYRSGEYCLTCHLVTVPAEVSGAKSFHLHTLFDQWRKSPWANRLNCVDCHMPRFQMDENGYTFFDHRIMGGNLDLEDQVDAPASEMPAVRDFTSYTRRYLAGDLRPGDYEVVAETSLYKFRRNPGRQLNAAAMTSLEEIRRFRWGLEFLAAGPIVNLELSAVEYLPAENSLRLRARTTNARVGHDFPSGPIDVQEIWLEALLTGPNGEVAAHIGGLDQDHRVDPRAPILGGRGIVDANGQPLLRHEFWKAAKVIDRRVLTALASVEDEVTLSLPASPAAEYRLILAWNFRRMNQRLVDWVWPGENRTATVMVLDRSETLIRLPRGADGQLRAEAQLLSRPPRAPLSFLPPAQDGR
jgi:hypothetical protein